MEDKQGTPWKSIKSGANGLRKSTKRLYQRVKHEFRSNRKPQDTKVESIHISPEPEVSDGWAMRSGYSSTSRSSGETDTRVSSASSATSRRSVIDKDNEELEIVHDMEDDLPGHGNYCS